MKYSGDMIQIQTKLTTQGQVSVPAAIRHLLSLTPGSTLVWTQTAGKVTVERAVRHSTAEVHHALFAEDARKADPFSAKPKPKTLTQLKQGIKQHMKQRHGGN